MAPMFNDKHQQRRELFNTLFDHAAASIAVVLADGTLLTFNRSFCAFLGYSEAELLRSNIFDLTFPADRELTATRFREGIAGKIPAFQYEKRYLRKDGGIAWGLVSGSWVVDGSGTAYGVALIQDLTARKQSEIALRASEELYRTLIENIDLGITLIGEDRRILKANAAMGRLLAKAPEAFVGQECFREFEKRDKVCEHCPGTQSMATGKPGMVITEGVRDDGSRAVVRLHTFPVPNPDGQARKFVEVVEDITERMEVRDALRESERRFRAVFENAAAGMYTISPQGRFLQVNRALYRFLGYAEAELLGLSLEDVTHPEDLALTQSMLRNALSELPFSWHCENRYRHKDGSALWAHVSGVWQLDEAGLPVYGIGLIQDITERKRSEAELLASAARYRRLFESNPHPMWIFDRQTLQFLAVNDAAIAHYGYSREQFLAMTIKAIRPPETVPALLAKLERMNEAGGQDWACHQCRNGRRIEVEIHAHNVDFDGRAARVVLVHDVTEKRRAQERMRLDAAALMSTRDAILITDRTPRILSVNPAFTEMTGYGEAEILGEHPRILSSSRHDSGFFKTMGEALLTNNHWQGEIWGRHKTGAVFPGWLTLSMVHNAEGKPTHFVGAITDLTKLKKSEERLQYLAHCDPLTDLPKRQLLESMLQHALERARRKGKWLAVLVLGLDQFKTINESFGHEAGDGLLVSLVERLRGQVRSADTLSRLAGDQFALILEGIADYSDIEVVARHVQTLVEPPFALGEGHRVYLRASIGISVSPQNGTSAQELLRGAEAAVNLAKERGGNQFCYCSAELNTQARTRLELQSEMVQALERQEFVLHYQPKVDLRSGRIVGAEALLRWISPTRGLISPLQFIPMAEKSGLIVPLGAWVIQQVCGQMRRWREAGLEKIGVAVNVSARQFRSGNLEELVAAALQDHGLEPQCLMLELTESMLMDDPEEAVNRLAGLRRTGVRIALDDFGTGYSSLGYLGRFPIDQLKIDRSFISEIVTDPRSATIATSIIALAHRMRLRVVAEGVETEAQLGYLRQYGCDEMQGYYFSKPLPAEAFAELLHQGRALPTPQEGSDAPTLLLVDDEPNILTALVRLLINEGYRVLTAGSGRAGLELLAQNAVQVIITDQRMPKMTGTEFLKRVKTLHPNTVRLILSGYADLPTVTESVNEGAVYKFLAKPWNNDHLCEQIRDAFGFYESNVNPLRERATND